MKYFSSTCRLSLAACLMMALGCRDATTHRANKPIVDSEPAEQVEEAAEEAEESLSEAADAVTPDESIVDIDTPLGNVDVGRDPATGGTNVEVDSGRADVDVSSDE